MIMIFKGTSEIYVFWKANKDIQENNRFVKYEIIQYQRLIRLISINKLKSIDIEFFHHISVTMTALRARCLPQKCFMSITSE